MSQPIFVISQTFTVYTIKAMAQSSIVSSLSILFLVLFFIHFPGGPMKLVNGQVIKTWCAAKPSATDSELSANIQFACNQLRDCKVIQEGGSCYNPNSLINHASVVMNLYYKAVGQNTWNCDFRGSALITQTDPSYGSCKYA